MDNEAALQSAVRAVNDSVGPNGLVPTLLFYGDLLRLGVPKEPSTPSMYQRATAVQKAPQDISKRFAQR